MNNTENMNFSNDSGSSEELKKIISANLKKLISQNNLTQKELAKQLKVAAASMTDYCKGRRIPNVEFFVSLKNQYHISIDDFLTKSITPATATLPAKKSFYDQNLMTTYYKYCGLYYIYYFDTSNYKGRDTQPPKDSLVYGVLFLYENPSSLEVPEFSCAAILGIKSREEVTRIRGILDPMETGSDIIDYIGLHFPNNAYYGDFELSQDHAFVSMRHANTDKALLIFHRVDNNKPDYTGGIGTINSVSKGRERMPVVQFMGISRHPLDMSIEEIHHALLLNYPTFKAEIEAEEMIRNFRTLQLDSDAPEQGFSDYQKTIVVRSALERYIRKSLERNMFRYGKISERDDDEWYHSIKAASIHHPDDKTPPTQK